MRVRSVDHSFFGSGVWIVRWQSPRIGCGDRVRPGSCPVVRCESVGNEFGRRGQFNSARKGTGAELATAGGRASRRQATPLLTGDQEINDELCLTSTTAINPRESRPCPPTLYIEIGQSLNPTARRTSLLGRDTANGFWLDRRCV